MPIDQLKPVLAALVTASLCHAPAFAEAMSTRAGSDEHAAQQEAAAARAMAEDGYGPQSPRDIDDPAGTNERVFSTAPGHAEMALCDIHLHKSAEHRGGEFTTSAGDGTGYLYSGDLGAAETAPLDAPIGEGAHGALNPGDTIEVHYVHSTAQAAPGPTLDTCLTDETLNPQLRVETQVMVLVNDAEARDFRDLAEVVTVDGLHQAPNIPADTGTPVVYTGSTTGPVYNEQPSPFHVTWSVRPQVVRVDAASLGRWFDDNAFGEKAAHGVRDLVTDPALLSPIEP